MIVLLCPTRGRPEQFKRMCESAFKTVSDKKNINIVYYTQEGDEKEDQYHGCHNGIIAIAGYDWPTVMSWNYMAQEHISGRNLLMLAADDMIFTTPGWDEALINHYNTLENKIHVYALRDSRGPEGTPHPIVTREWIEAMGYFILPIFLHWFSDTWTVEIAKANNCFTHLTDFLLTHDKPSDKGQADETHNRIRRMGWWERDSYVNKTCGHFLEYEKQRLKEKMI